MYIANNQEDAQQLESLLGKTIYQNVDQFISYYNSGQITKNHPEIKTIAEQISEIYSNIDFKNKMFIVKSDDEIALTTIQDIIGYFPEIVMLKRVASDLLASGRDHETKIIFQGEEKDFGFPYVEDEVSDEEGNFAIAKIPNTGKVFGSAEKIASNLFIQDILQDYSLDDSVYVTVGNVMNVDTGFLTEVADLMKDAVTA